MAKINLRPWREELRAERQQQFLVMLAGTVLFGAALVFFWNGYVESEIEYQDSRNNYLDTSMKELDKKIKEIRELKSKREDLLERMKVIQDLQGTRPLIVRVFDEVVKTLPDGLYYTFIGKKADSLDLKGVAESNSRISALMRNFDRSDWFSDPNLTAVNAVKLGEPASQFVMKVKQQTPGDHGEKQK